MSTVKPIEVPLIPLSLFHVGIRIDLGDGKSPICVFDTGAAVTVIDKKLATPIADGFSGLTSIGGAGGSSLGSLASISLSVSGNPPSDEIAALADIETLRRFLREDIGGIVGPGFLARYVTELDLGAKVLRLHSDDYTPPTEAIELKLERIANLTIPAVRAKIGDAEVLLGLDTGAGIAIALLSPDNAVQRVLPTKRIKSPGRGFAGNFDAEQGRGLTIGLGPLLLENLPFLLSKKSKIPALKSAGLAGVVGPQALLGPKSRWIFDKKRQRVWVIADRTAPLRDRAGLILVQEKSVWKVESVLPQTPAADASIKEGEIFVGIVGSDANSRPEIAKAFAQPTGTKLELLVKKTADQNPRTVPLVLRDYP
jgi:hypothetical protein